MNDRQVTQRDSREDMRKRRCVRGYAPLLRINSERVARVLVAEYIPSVDTLANRAILRDCPMGSTIKCALGQDVVALRYSVVGWAAARRPQAGWRLPYQTM